MTERKIIKSIAAAAAVFIALMMAVMSIGTGEVWAAQGSVGIDAAQSVNKGDVFTVKVSYSGDSLSRVRGMMRYDTSVLKYISGGTSKGNGGAVELRGTGEGGDISFSVKFKAVGKGKSSLSVKTREMYDIDEMDMGNPSSSASVSVAAQESVPAEDEQSQDAQQEEQKPDEENQDQDKEQTEEESTDQEDTQAASGEDESEGDIAAVDTAADEEQKQDGVSDKVKIIAIIAAAVLTIAVLNIIILRARKKK